MGGKVAVILLNLGGPDSKAAIKPFLMNFFMDKNIISLPLFFRYILANRIANKRSKQEAGAAYGALGNKSPLLENSQAQATALEETLNTQNDGNTYKVFVCMRYWHPMAPQVVRDVRDWGAEKIMLLPLYPQFSTTTTWSSLQVWQKSMSEIGMETQTSMVCCYPENAGYVEASAEHIKLRYDEAIKAGHTNIRILFSAHGLPEKVIKKGDPYQYQCEHAAEKIAVRLSEVLNVDTLDWQICYQSRVGRLKWVGPSIEEAIDKATSDEVAIIIYPHAFTQEHVETLVELDIEYKDYAQHKGQIGYYRAETVGTHPAFIKGLAKLVNEHTPRNDIAAEGFKRICPDTSGKCCMRTGHLRVQSQNKKAA